MFQVQLASLCSVKTTPSELRRLPSADECIADQNHLDRFLDQLEQFFLEMKLHCLLVFLALRALETSHAYLLSPKSLSITCRPSGDTSFSRLQAEERWPTFCFSEFASSTACFYMHVTAVTTLIIAFHLQWKVT